MTLFMIFVAHQSYTVLGAYLPMLNKLRRLCVSLSFFHSWALIVSCNIYINFHFRSFLEIWLFSFGLPHWNASIKANTHFLFGFSLYLTIKVNGSLWQIHSDWIFEMNIGYLIFVIQTAGILTGNFMIILKFRDFFNESDQHYLCTIN